MREYNVALKEGVDYDGFWNDMESDTDGGKLYIPNRAVQYTNERPASLRQCWYLLTDEEAELLRQDDRVYCVEIPPEHRDDIVMAPMTTQTGDFTKTSSDSGAYLNWGLIRASNSTNVYGTGTTTALNYDYTLDGTGVDVVIQDSGIQVDHPEFEDGSGNSRVQQIDWAAASGLAFTQNANHYRDYDGHGTHVAGIAAGKTYGWAKNARIYAVKLSGLEGSGDSGTGISVTYAFDCIKNWHTAKAGSRPTVVNMSWGYYTTFGSVTSVTYRGVTYTDSTVTSGAASRLSNYGIMQNGIANVRVDSVDVDLQEMLAAGIVVCVAAGNRSYKIDLSTGVDYNNYYNNNTPGNYYHRGSSPHDENAISVGNADSTVYNASLDQKATTSETGPGVDIWAPGTNIMSATSNTNSWGVGSQNYYLNSSYKQTNISGTSMASPQVAGVCALILQLNPSYTPAQVKSALLASTTTTIYDTGLANDWSDYRSLKGGAAKFLYANYQSIPVTEYDTDTYLCKATKGGYLYWTDLHGNSAYCMLNGGRSRTIQSTTYPSYEKGANISIQLIS